MAKVIALSLTLQMEIQKIYLRWENEFTANEEIEWAFWANKVFHIRSMSTLSV
jgi:hypothetical protein